MLENVKLKSVPQLLTTTNQSRAKFFYSSTFLQRVAAMSLECKINELQTRELQHHLQKVQTTPLTLHVWTAQRPGALRYVTNCHIYKSSWKNQRLLLK